MPLRVIFRWLDLHNAPPFVRVCVVQPFTLFWLPCSCFPILCTLIGKIHSFTILTKRTGKNINAKNTTLDRSTRLNHRHTLRKDCHYTTSSSSTAISTCIALRATEKIPNTNRRWSWMREKTSMHWKSILVKKNPCVEVGISDIHVYAWQSVDKSLIIILSNR